MTLRVAGHPLHAMLTHFPIALLFAGAACDGAAWFRAELEPIARFALIAGLVTALPAGLVGMIDWAVLAPEPRVQRIANRHILFISAALVPFAVSLWVRTRFDASVELVLDALGCALLGGGAWHGGELVYGHAVGVRGTPRSSLPPKVS